MLHSINLLAWREERRETHRKRFITMVGIGSIFAVLLQWSIGFYMEQQQEWQQQRNHYLKNHMLMLDNQIEQLKVVEQEHHTLLTRLAVVEELQMERNKTVDFMNLLPRLIPQGVYLDKVKMSGQQIEMAGISESTALLATMLENLEKSPAVAHVEMHSIVHGITRFSRKYQSYNVSFSILGADDEKG